MRGCTVAINSAFGKISQPLVRLFAASRLALSRKLIQVNLLELVQPLLPSSITLDTYFHTAKDHLLAPTKVNSQLDDIAIFYAKRLGLDVWLAQSYVVEEGARRALDILNVPIASMAPQLAMFPTNNLGFEANGGSRGGVWRVFRNVVAFRVSSYTDNGRLVRQGASDGGELQRGPASSGVLVWNEANRR